MMPNFALWQTANGFLRFGLNFILPKHVNLLPAVESYYEGILAKSIKPRQACFLAIRLNSGQIIRPTHEITNDRQ